jgi:hypothetical protein
MGKSGVSYLMLGGELSDLCLSSLIGLWSVPLQGSDSKGQRNIPSPVSGLCYESTHWHANSSCIAEQCPRPTLTRTESRAIDHNGGVGVFVTTFASIIWSL